MVFGFPLSKNAREERRSSRSSSKRKARVMNQISRRRQGSQKQQANKQTRPVPCPEPAERRPVHPGEKPHIHLIPMPRSKTFEIPRPTACLTSRRRRLASRRRCRCHCSPLVDAPPCRCRFPPCFAARQWMLVGQTRPGSGVNKDDTRGSWAGELTFSPRALRILSAAASSIFPLPMLWRIEKKEFVDVVVVYNQDMWGSKAWDIYLLGVLAKRGMIYTNRRYPATNNLTVCKQTGTMSTGK